MAVRTTKRSTKPTGLLKALTEGKRGTSTLIGDIQQYVVKKAENDYSRRQDIIHPSETTKTDWCPRSTAYRISGVTPTDEGEVKGAHLQTIFQEGHDIHAKWQTWLGEMGRLWGKWVCHFCEAETWQTGAECPLCGKTMDYREVPLDVEKEFLTAGHADGAVPDVKSFIEIKSVGLGTLRMEEPDLVKKFTVKTSEGKNVVDYDNLWKNLKHPLKSHRIQANMYLYIAAHLGWDYDHMIFIYENKANQQTKEFRVKYDPEFIEPIIDQIKDVKWSVTTGQTLSRPVGFSKELKPCTTCVFRSHCYKGDESSGSKSVEEQEPPTRNSKSRSEEATRTPANSSPRSPRRRPTGTAGRSNRTYRS